MSSVAGSALVLLRLLREARLQLPHKFLHARDVCGGGGVEGLGFGVWGLGFGVWGLGFGV